MTPPAESVLAVLFRPDTKAEDQAKTLTQVGGIKHIDKNLRRHDPFLTTYLVASESAADLAHSLSADGRVDSVKIIRMPHGLISEATDWTDPPFDSRPIIIAGPCSIESESQICEIAHMVKDAGATALRGGAFKPRTSPYSFAGLGERGLQYLARAKESTGLPIITEVLNPSDIEIVSQYADVLQIGARNMHNAPLIFAAAKNSAGLPLFLKRGFGSKLNEFLLAAEGALLGRLSMKRSVSGVFLCERGIRTFEDAMRFTFDVGAIPFLKEKTALPVIADPSHPAGTSRFVLSLAKSAISAGADGLMLEVHASPLTSWSDSTQTISPQQFKSLVQSIQAN